ncbi:MAG TPA: hypothetical protein VHX38_36520 [Pseudonocardiaceae bacterium]|nr:hypothetical protein [Pseudonocardiaceae bacterium]
MTRGEPGRRGPAPKRVDVSVHESWLPREHALYRPRHSGRQRAARICAVVFFVAPLAGLLVFGPAPALENHPKAPFPSLSQGWGFFTGLGPWAVDNLSFREGAIKLADGISQDVFGEPAQFGQGNQDVGPLPGGNAPVNSQAIPPQPQQDQTSDGYPEVILGSGGWMYFGYDIQGKCEPAQPLSTIVTNLNRLKSAIEASGRTFVLYVPPDKSSVEPQHLPPNYVGKSCASAADKQFWQAMDGLGAIDPRQAIDNASKQSGQPIYFPQDTHWDYDGGLIMTRELAERIQPGVSATWKVTKGPVRTAPSDLPPMIAEKGTNTSNIYHLAPNGGANRDQQRINTDGFAPVTMHTANPVTGMITTNTTMVGDSFTQYGAPLLAATFANLTFTNIENVASYTDDEANRIVANNVVVFEVVERNLISGVSPITSDAFVDAVTAAVAAHPLH